ncbi:MAG TPA: DUF4388 domain-containing protein, partial [Polyangiales bacterium]|nr:DUF4388 domain-containing protein [Polyangiales bacterium]
MAEGNLARTPLNHLMLYIHREGLSGTLIIDRGGVEAKIAFRNGRAVAARLFSGSASLHQGLLELCDLAEGPFSFWEGDRIGEGPGALRGTVDPISFAAEALRGHVRDEVVSHVLERYRGVSLRVPPDVDPRRMGLRGNDARFVDALREAPATLEELEAHSPVGVDQARRLLYLLLITWQALPDGVEASSTSGVRAAITVPPGMAGNRTQPPTVSSRPPPASSSSPAPSSTPTPSSSTPAAPSGSMFPNAGARSSAPPSGSRSSLPAWQQLASWRATGGSSSRVPSNAPPPVEALDDVGKLRRAEQLIERRSFGEASRILDDLIHRLPSNADHHATRAWLLCLQLTGERAPRALIEAIENA